MGKGTVNQPQAVNTIPPEFMDFAKQLRDLLAGGLGQAGQGQQNFMTQGGNFLTQLLQGQLPDSIRSAAARNLQESQNALNSQLQLRGGFFGTPGLQQQRQLAENYGTGLSNMVFQNAMGAIPQGLGLYGQPINQALQFLGGTRGQVGQASYTPDPLTEILKAAIPFGKWTFP